MPSIIFKVATVIVVVLSSVNLYAEPSGRGDPDAPDLGLPSGTEVGTGFLIAIITIPIGYLILKSSEDDGVGCVCLLPLIAWIYGIGQIIMSIGLTIVIVVFVFALIFGNKDK